MKKMIRIGLAAFMCVLSAGLSGQNFAIKRIEQSVDGLILFYDLVDTEKSRSFNIQLFSSHNNFSQPLQKVSGDVGFNVKPGINKKIAWNAKSELGNSFTGDVQLEVRGKVYTPALVVKSPVSDPIKRTSPIALSWTSEAKTDKVLIQLFQDNQLIKSYKEISNSGKTRIAIPAAVTPGQGYYFRLSLKSVPDNFVKTNSFEVKRRFSTLAKVVPVAVVGGAVLFILSGTSEGDSVVSPPGVPGGKN